MELSEKAILIKIGINPPKWHDVIDIILEEKNKIMGPVYDEILSLRRCTKWLRSQKEIAFYGDVDFLLLKEYTIEDDNNVIEIAKRFFILAEKQNF